MKVFRGFAVASALLAFSLAVLGSWVRINDAGMTCPDWPLCNGRLVPSLAGGVIFEWSHRLVALLLSVPLLGLFISGWRMRERIAGVGPALGALGGIFALQVLLGGATVHLNNSPWSVVLHWGTAMLLIATLTILAVLSIVRPQRTRWTAGLAPVLGLAAGFGFLAMCVGAYVSSSYAGLACANFPTCDGSLLGHGQAQFAQMLHRFAAAAFAIAAAAATLTAAQTGSARVRAFALGGFALIGVQIALGVANVLGALPMPLREAHAANAGLTFVCFVIATALAAIDPLIARAPVRERHPMRRTVTGS